MTGMRQLRSHLFAVAAVTLALHAGVVSLGALRACWATEHRHAGVAVADCVMHHPTGSSSGDHTHHAHGTAPSAGDAGERVVCSCSNDTSTPYVGPTAIVGPAAGLAYVALSEIVTTEDSRSRADLRVPPLPPPPRSILSPRS